jgi:hypothetical protein
LNLSHTQDPDDADDVDEEEEEEEGHVPMQGQQQHTRRDVGVAMKTGAEVREQVRMWHNVKDPELMEVVPRAIVA